MLKRLKIDTFLESQRIQQFTLQPQTIKEMTKLYPTRHTKPSSSKKELFETSSSFPLKLFYLLNVENTAVIEWLPHGQSFRVNDPHRFCTEVAPHYFKREFLLYLTFILHASLSILPAPLAYPFSVTYTDTKMTSFQRQLNLYGFRRVIKGEEQGCYFHPQFHRDHPELISDIRRVSHLTEQTHADTIADDDSTHENHTHETTPFVSPRVAEMLANTRCRKPTTKKSSYTVKPHIISPRLTPSNNTTKSAFNFDTITTRKSATTVQASRSSTRISTHTTPSYTEPDDEEEEDEDLSQADNLSGSCASDNRANSVHPHHTKHNKSIPTQIDTKSPKPRSMSSLSSRFGYQDKAPSTIQHPKHRSTPEYHTSHNFYKKKYITTKNFITP